MDLARLLSVISLPGDPFSEEVYRDLKLDRVRVYSKTFPDGETYIRLSGRVESEKVIIVQSMYPDQDRRLVEILELLDILRDYRGEKLALLPYLAYARQDKMFLEGEPVTVRIVLETLIKSGLDRIYVVEPHSSRFIDNNKVIEIRGVEIMASILRERLKNVLRDRVYVVSPDQGGVKRASEFAKIIGGSLMSFVKYRDRYSGEIRITPPEDINLIRDSSVFIVDDILSTGGTVVEVAKTLLKHEPRRLYIVCVHCLFAERALEMIESIEIERVFCGNTVSRKTTSNKVEYIDLSYDIMRLLLRDLKI
ncbi:MAG: ribose-phosphate diphosphokinase [Sulfolobales archaeon]